jgi:hypothetical protein
VDDRIDIELVESAGKRYQRGALDVKYRLLGLFSRFLVTPSVSRTLSRAQVFCCFVGHGRSGGTLVGALLNAHQNVVMSNELNALRRLRLGMKQNDLYRLIYIVSKRQVSRGSRGGGGYNYAITGQWQGKHGDILVIGDRKAGASAHELNVHPNLLGLLDERIRLTKKFIHVVRNPFDTIATTFKKTIRRSGSTEYEHLQREIHNYFARCQVVKDVESHFGRDSVHYLDHEELLTGPHATLSSLCLFLGLEASADYLDACAGILMQSPHRTRASVKWQPEHVSSVTSGIKNFPWLRRYLPAD